MAKPDEIVLALNQNANRGECGSCQFFDREDSPSEWVQRGRCKFRSPPSNVYAKQVWDPECQPLDTVKDTDGCDFWKSSGHAYIVSQRLKP